MEYYHLELRPPSLADLQPLEIFPDPFNDSVLNQEKVLDQC